MTVEGGHGGGLQQGCQGSILRLARPCTPLILQDFRCCDPSLSPSNPPACSAEAVVAQRIALALGEAEGGREHIQLTVSGMSAIFTAHRILKRLHGATGAAGGGSWEGMQVVVWGFPYLDTLKVCAPFASAFSAY